ncbi:hypothetical protein SAMD00019534_121520, partial [Acytostelium subglobosum LB1]|uniref:hypothetical protein n=1 Tax=Acytostelium subglobosum LB1 TaxID=1410327 RepID=UPI0006448856
MDFEDQLYTTLTYNMNERMNNSNSNSNSNNSNNNHLNSMLHHLNNSYNMKESVNNHVLHYHPYAKPTPTIQVPQHQLLHPQQQQQQQYPSIYQSPLMSMVPNSSPFVSPRGSTPPQLFLCSTPTMTSSSPSIGVSSDSIRLEYGGSQGDLSEATSPKKNGFFEMTANLLDLCKRIDNERGVSEEKSKMLTLLHDELDIIVKRINKVKKNKLPYAPILPEKAKSDFIDLRPRRNRRCKLVQKENEDNLQCLRCGTKESPEWRKGPDGCKSLCNACGLYYAKTKKRESELSDSNGSINIASSTQQLVTKKQAPLSSIINSGSGSNSSTSLISINSLINN